MNTELTTYYVSFNASTFFSRHCAVVKAQSKRIVTAWMNKNYPRVWNRIYTAKPNCLEPFSHIESLYYEKPEHV